MVVVVFGVGHCSGGFCCCCCYCDRCLKEEVGMAEVGCGSWLGPMFRSLVVVGSSVWVVVGLLVVGDR